MKYRVSIPYALERTLMRHLFQGDLEQGGFLFARVVESGEEVLVIAADAYLVQPDGWEKQTEDYLELKDSERAKIMKIARDGDFALIDCHSHPGSGMNTWFSTSDRYGITEFAGYVMWKLDKKPYVATVWGEASIDAVAWHGDFTAAIPVEEVRVGDGGSKILLPKGTWYLKPKYSWQERSKWATTGIPVKSSLSGRKGNAR